MPSCQQGQTQFHAKQLTVKQPICRESIKHSFTFCNAAPKAYMKKHSVLHFDVKCLKLWYDNYIVFKGIYFFLPPIFCLDLHILYHFFLLIYEFKKLQILAWRHFKIIKFFKYFRIMSHFSDTTVILVLYIIDLWSIANFSLSCCQDCLTKLLFLIVIYYLAELSRQWARDHRSMSLELLLDTIYYLWAPQRMCFARKMVQHVKKV